MSHILIQIPMLTNKTATESQQ